jgi:uroporphyrinogen-III synthase
VDKSLAGKNIVITRPAAQSEQLATLVRERGGNPILFPALEILPLDDLRPLSEILSRVRQFDVAIFVSSNAVNHSLPHLRGGWPEEVQIAAMGAGTKRSLHAFGIDQIIVPKGGADSEHLLEAPELQDMTAKRVVIFRGQGGRELLREILVERGARVEYAECYRRATPNTDPATLIELWAKDQLHSITVTSNEALRNLFAIFPPAMQRQLRETALFVPHPRIAAAARELGCVHVVTTGAGDEGLIAGLIAWFGTKI